MEFKCHEPQKQEKVIVPLLLESFLLPTNCNCPSHTISIESRHNQNISRLFLKVKNAVRAFFVAYCILKINDVTCYLFNRGFPSQPKEVQLPGDENSC